MPLAQTNIFNSKGQKVWQIRFAYATFRPMADIWAFNSRPDNKTGWASTKFGSARPIPLAVLFMIQKSSSVFIVFASGLVLSQLDVGDFKVQGL